MFAFHWHVSCIFNNEIKPSLSSKRTLLVFVIFNPSLYYQNASRSLLYCILFDNDLINVHLKA